MDSRLRVADNAVHPLLLMFPLGLFAIALILDVAIVAGAPRLLASVAHGTVVAGLVGGVLAISVACVDVASTRDARAARIAVLGVLLDLSVLIFFAVIALVRLRTDDHVAESGLLLVELLGLAAAGVSTWFGGRLGPRRAPRLRVARRVAGPAGAGIPRG